MPRGFFPKSKVFKKAPLARIAQCGACGLLKTCRSPKMEVTGQGRRKILFVGEAPGKEDDRNGKFLSGPGGEALQKILRTHDVDLRKDCWSTDALICRPPDNRDPTPKELDYCLPNLRDTIKELQPEIIIPLGRFGIHSVMTLAWKEAVGSGNRWLGWRIPHQNWNCWICPTFHPVFISETTKPRPVEGLMWRQHLEAACELQGRPWEEVPDYKSQVEIILEADKAARVLRKMIAKGGHISFDYETTTIKPEHANAQIVSCAVCWEGKKTIAFPWYGEAIVAMREVLRSPNLTKSCCNIKFEERWTMEEFGHGVRKWKHCALVGAHWEDSRSDITSLKFQSFVRLGQESYDDHIKPFLKQRTKVKVNQVLKEVDLRDLLLYNGLDAILEFHVTTLQRKALAA